MRRLWVVHLTVFLVSYLVFLAYFLHRSPSQTANNYSVHLQQTVRNIETTILSPLGRGSFGDGSSSRMAKVEVSPQRTPGAPYNYPSSEDTSTLSASTLVPDESSAHAYFNSLDQAVRTDESAANRIAAVLALRQLASNGDPDGTILEALRVATQDGDPAVVGAALPAYNEAQALKAAR